MPRIVYETPCRPRPTPPPERDRTLALIRLATFALAVALVGGFFLVSGGSSPRAGSPVAAPAAAPSTTSRTPVVAPPVAGTLSAEIVPTPREPSPPPPPATERPPAAPATPGPTAAPPESRRGPAPRPDPRFAVLGESCSRPGEYSVTERYRPVVCRDGSWRRAF
jgi:hypothetical protein